MNINKTILATLGLSASFFAAGVLSAQSGSTKAPAPAAGAPTISSTPNQPTKLVKVSTLNGAEANQNFQRNVQLVQAQRQAAVELNQQVEKETNPTKKKELKAQLDEALKNLNENNQKMIKAYGFSLDRNYQLVIETAHILMFVSDEEAAKIEKEQAAQAAAAAKAAPTAPAKK